MKPLFASLVALAFAALAAGCGTLPDARPFADATSTLAVSVRASGQALTDSLREAGSVVPDDKAEYDKIVTQFEAAWTERVKAAQGAVAYSDSIADLIEASAQAADTVKRVGDSLVSLAGAANIVVPATPVIGVVSDVANFLADRIATVRASRSLEEAVTRAQPAVDRIAEQMASDTERQLKPNLERAYKNIVSGIKGPYDPDQDFATGFRKRQAQMRAEVLKDPGKVAQLQEFDKVQANVAASLRERDQKIDQAAAAYKARLQLVNALSTATLAWASAHRDLAAAIREKRKVSATELQENVIELKELIRKVRAL